MNLPKLFHIKFPFLFPEFPQIGLTHSQRQLFMCNHNTLSTIASKLIDNILFQKLKSNPLQKKQ